MIRCSYLLEYHASPDSLHKRNCRQGSVLRTKSTSCKRGPLVWNLSAKSHFNSLIFWKVNTRSNRYWNSNSLYRPGTYKVQESRFLRLGGLDDPHLHSTRCPSAEAGVDDELDRGRNIPSRKNSGHHLDHPQWNRWEWAAGYTNCQEWPQGYKLEVTHGELPPGLSGTYFRNGPGHFDFGCLDRVAHPFDGDGIVISISVNQGEAFFRSRFVETKERELETKKGRRIFKGSFGTVAPGGFWQNLLEVIPRNAANTNVIFWAGTCLALFETLQTRYHHHLPPLLAHSHVWSSLHSPALPSSWEALGTPQCLLEGQSAAQPYRLDPETLRTEGLETLGGRLRVGAPFTLGSAALDRLAAALLDSVGVASAGSGGVRLGGDAFSAHPHLCERSGRLVTFSYRIRLRLEGLRPRLETELTFYELDDAMRVVCTKEYTLDGYAFVHDFQVTDGHYVVFQNPVELDLAPLLLGTKSAVESVRFRPERNARVHLIPRAPEPRGRQPGGDLPAAVVEVEPCFVFHFVGSAEEAAGDGRTRFTVDCIRYPTMPDFEDFMGYGAGFEYVRPEKQPKSELWRLEILKEAGTARFRRVSPRALEFGTSSPGRSGPARYAYAAAALHPTLNMPQQMVARVDMASGSCEGWSRGEHYYVGEPLYVPRPGPGEPDSGWVIAMGYDGLHDRSEFLVFDAQSLGSGPVAVCGLREPVPHGLHGCWAEAADPGGGPCGRLRSAPTA